MNITSDSTKYHYAMEYFDPTHAIEVEDIIMSPPSSDKYERLKTELVKRCSLSKEKKLRQLLTKEELGDQRPSQFLHHLQYLAGPSKNDDFVLTIWLDRLPTSTQAILTTQARATPEELADLADKLQDIAVPTPHVAATSTSGRSTDSLTTQIEVLTRQVASLTTRIDRMSRSTTLGLTPANRRRSSSRTRSQSNYRKFPLCWYHFKHGNNANKCKKPCDYTAGNA